MYPPLFFSEYAFYFGKKIFLLNDFFEPYADELVAWGAIPLKKNIEKIQ